MTVSGIIWGDKGVGKSTAIVRSFPDWAYLLTSRSALKRAELEGHKPTVRKVFSEFRAGKYTDFGLPIRSATLKNVRNELRKIEQEKIAGTFPYAGVVISEFSTIIRWVYDDVIAMIGKTNPRTGVVKMEGRSTFDKSAVCLSFVNWIVGFASRNDLGLILECHGRPVTYHAEGPNEGEVKYPAGPLMPEGAMIAACARPLDFCWEMCGIEEEGGVLTKIAVKTRPGDAIVRGTRGSLNAIEELSEEEGVREKLIKAKLLSDPTTTAVKQTAKKKERAQ